VQCAQQREMQTSSSSLIIIFVMMEDRKRKKKTALKHRSGQLDVAYLRLLGPLRSNLLQVVYSHCLSAAGNGYKKRVFGA